MFSKYKLIGDNEQVQMKSADPCQNVLDPGREGL
jgi:hypothetical protein